jgi:hypothetical protein
MCHPILEAASALVATLEGVAGANPVFMSTGDKAAALTELTRVGARLDELRLRVLACADDVADDSAARDAAEWLARHGRERFDDVRKDLRLALAMDTRFPVLGAAMRDGEVTRAQAQVIATALDRLPDEIPADLVSAAEARLVKEAGSFGPRELANLGRHIVEMLAPEIGEAAEAKRLAAIEAAAHRQTTLMLRRGGDGMTRLSGLLPDVSATRLATYLEAFTNPRKAGSDPVGLPPSGAAADDPVRRLPYGRRLGEAFCQLLETIDPQRLPIHGGDATTIMITLSLDQLRRDLAAAEVVGASHLPGSDEPVLLTAADARRLACMADLIPVVLGGDSRPLDLGRTRRLFSSSQRKAMQLRDRHCLADGCQIPAAWCEAHHWHPWARGGRTDLADGGLLCAHHHHRAHDPTYVVVRLPDGRVRFHRRS